MKVLVIEDEHRIARTIKKGLEQEKYTVDLAFDGEDGFDKATTVDYDVVVLDLMLPKMDGLTVCQKLREMHVETPVLMLTAKGQIQDKVEGFNQGADDYLTKPFAFAELVARIKALSRRKPQIKTDLLTLLDLTINTDTFEVKRGNTNILLSNKEYSLLEYLIRHPNQILTKEQIIEHVWSYDADILPNTVEVFIRNLRKKIDLDFDTKLIKTVRGFGYKISIE